MAACVVDLITTFEADTLKIRVPVTESPSGDVFPLSGATIDYAGLTDGLGNHVTATGTITDAASGIITVTVAADALESRRYNLQVRVSVAGETQTVLSQPILVNKSQRVPT